MWPNNSPPNRGRASSYLCTNYRRSIVGVSSHGRLRFGTTSSASNTSMANETRSRRNYNFKLLFFVAAWQRARPKWRLFAAVTRCVSAVLFFAIRRYLPVVMFFNDDGAEQRKPFRVISIEKKKKILNVSARVFQGFRRYFAWQPRNKKGMCVVSHQILQPEGDVFGIRHRLLNSSARECVCAPANLVGRATYVNVDSTFLTALFRVRVRVNYRKTVRM